MKLDVNNTVCIKQVENLGGTTIHNICNGTEHWVPWGDMDWILFAIIVVLLLFIGLVVTWAIKEVL